MAVGAGVAVGTGVAVGAGVAVGTGILVGSGVFTVISAYGAAIAVIPSLETASTL